MDSSIFKKAGELLSRKSKYRHWQAVVAVLGVAVMGTTAIILSHPAQTLTKETYCGMEEHVHTAECYQPVLICGLEEEVLVEVDEKVVPGGTESPVESLQPTPEATQTPEREPHRHDDSCYEEYLVLDCEETEAPIHQLGCYAGAEMLICGQEESADHIHTDECYDVVPVKALACGQEESDTHTHSEDGEDSCYIVLGAKKLICGMEESEEHTHTEECYELIPEEKFQCMEGHTHTESCYPQDAEPALICGLEEQEAHTHTEECYTVTEKEELTCGQEASDTHEHTADCYETVEVKELTCGKEETEGHTHTEQCYSQDGEKTPICGREEKEVSPADAHVHTIACCRTEKKLICGKEEYIPEETVEPASEETTESTATPEATTEPEATPEGSTQPQATAEATTEPENSPEASIQPTATAEASTQPEAVQVSGAPQESTAPESTVSPAPGEEGKHVHTEACYEMRLVCGLEEHTHTDDCYKVAYCGIPAHVHMPGCYDEEGNVICGKEEHIHEGNCYKEPHCGITAHTHAEECYDENGELICGMEEHIHGDECFVEEDTYTGPFHCQEKIHQHTADCYDEENNLICGMADYVIHTHTEACYDEEGQLICPLPEIEEHAHSAQCYDIPGEGEEAVLTCGKEEAKLHTHTEECYDEEGNLTCGMLQTEEHVHSEACLKETEKAHIHTANCYDGMGNLICGYKEAHTHTEECYDEEGKLICGFEEEAEELPYYCAEYVHKHSEECYDENQNLICGKADFVAHVHTEDCYNKAGELICPLPEIEAHTHSAACYSEANGQLEAELICGKTEDIKLHTHTEECYDADGKLSCGKLEVLEHVHSEACHVDSEKEEVHEHGKNCYDAEGKLICGYTDAKDHEHDADCYNEEDKLICGFEGMKDHEHDAKCYDENGELKCGYNGVKDHEHDAKCKDEEGNLICGYEGVKVHEHDARCYDILGNLICGYEGVVDHAHTEACYDEEGTLICGYEVPEVFENSKVYEGGNYIVVVKYNNDANIPEEAQLITEEITPDSDAEHYENREAEYKAAMKDKAATMRALLKIGFYLDGVEVEPATPVAVSVQFLDEDGLAEGKPITVVHFAAEGTTRLNGSDAKNNSTTFTMESFSEIAIGYGIKEPDITEYGTVHISDSFEYEDDAFRITFFVEGEATPVDEGILKKDSITTEPESGVDGESVVSSDAEENNTVDNDNETAESEGTRDTFTQETDKALQGDTEAEENVDKGEGLELENQRLNFKVESLDKDSEEYAALANYADEIDELDELLRMQILSYSMSLGDVELDLSDCEVTAEVAPTKKLQDYMETSLPEAVSYLANNDATVEGESEAEQADESEESGSDLFSDAGIKDEEVSEGDSVTNSGSDLEVESTFEDSEIRVYGDEETNVEDDIEIEDDTQIQIAVAELSEADEVTEVQDMILSEEAKYETMRFPLRSNVFAVRSITPGVANPEFKVEYYANLKRVVKSGGSGTELQVINTSNGSTSTKNKGEGKGALPENGKGLTTTPNGKELQTIYLNNKGEVQTEETLTKVYAPKTYEYKEAPSLMYFDCLVENAGYKVVEVWVKYETDPSTGGEGFEPFGIKPDKNGWYKYTYDAANPTLHFTNRRLTAEQEKNYVYINTGATIRLVYDPVVERTNPFDAKFYDYNIANGKTGNVWNTSQTGINIAKNYKGSGAKYAFGNANCGTGLDTQKWGSNYINRYNRTSQGGNDSYQGCVFGLVNGIKGNDKEGYNVKFSEKVNGLEIFGSNSLNGKDIYPGGTLNFSRSGDTYTLTSANSTVGSVNNLDVFTKLTEKDNGSSQAFVIWSNNFWPMEDADASDPKTGKKGSPVKRTGGEFPVSDNGIAHNNFFGMHYIVSFNLDKDYVGPLEYLFFGDDDMWVFLDGKLICDLGGVHSSVGEYVNLWDWLTTADKGKEHTLHFFYTERGASGSSCWMQFTLPSVTSIPLQQNTGTIRFEKSVVDSESKEQAYATDDEFSFHIKLENTTGVELRDDYCYAKYHYNEETKTYEEIGKDIILFSGSDFTLKSGEYIIIKYLPVGTKYTIEEKDVGENYLKPMYQVIKTQGGKEELVKDWEENVKVDSQISEKGVEYKVKFKNLYKVFSLPATGGSGTIPYTVAGTTIVLLSGAGLMYRKKFRERRG